MKKCLRLVSAASVGLPGLPPLPDKFARSMRRCDMLTRAAIAAVYYCIENLKCHGMSPDLRECAIFTGLGTGTLETNLAFVDSLFEQEGAGSPTLFSHSVHNTVAGYISRLFDVHGFSFTITDFAWPFLAALREAQCFISNKKVNIAIVVTAETESPFLRDVRKQLMQKGIYSSWQYGAAAWLVAGPCVQNLPGADIEEFYLFLQNCTPSELLLRLTEQYPCVDRGQVSGPLGYVFSLDQMAQDVLKGKIQQGHWRVKAGFGKAGLSFNKS